jgi:hypothetical protein
MILFAALLAIAPLAHANDACNITQLPAATLLLPYFEVAFDGSVTTLFTITNTSKVPQIAHVVMWTDLGYPTLDFNIFLTGYDVQPINLYDIFVNATIGRGTSNQVTPGYESLPNNANPHFLPDAQTLCTNLPGRIPAYYTDEIRTIFTTGKGTLRETCDGLGQRHPNAIGYLTIDVVATCTTAMPYEKSYWDVVLFDNVLTGDYEIIDSKNKLATGSPLVHLRATDGLPYTFYDRFVPSPGKDKRQPLPSAFAARVIDGGGLTTEFVIWHEPLTGASAKCADYMNNRSVAADRAFFFDEHENVFGPGYLVVTETPPMLIPTTWSIPSRWIGEIPSDDLGGWMRVDLDDLKASRPSQNWVISRLVSGTMTVQLDATALGNACAP